MTKTAKRTTKPCKECGGTGKTTYAECYVCEGSGQVLTYLENSWLIQRLRKPIRATNPESVLAKMGDNPFSFGGGLKNGGLSDEAMGLIRDIFNFDYMGAAEFEFGAVPRAFQTIAKNVETYTAWSFDLPLKDVAPHWRDKDQDKTKKPEGSATIYVICPQDEVEEVQARIRFYAKNPHGNSKNRNYGLMEPTMLSNTLRPDSTDTDRDRDVFNTWGWLELNNGFMFFADEEMFAKTADLFGLDRT